MDKFKINSINRIYDDIYNSTDISKEDNINELISKYKETNDERYRICLIHYYLPSVYKISLDYIEKYDITEDLEDILMSGVEGLTKAIELYKENYSSHFGITVNAMINRSITNHIIREKNYCSSIPIVYKYIDYDNIDLHIIIDEILNDITNNLSQKTPTIERKIEELKNYYGIIPGTNYSYQELGKMYNCSINNVSEDIKYIRYRIKMNKKFKNLNK